MTKIGEVCYMKFQVRVGYRADGSARTRTFGIRGVRPDISPEDAAACARAIASLLAYPVIRVYLLHKTVWETEPVLPSSETAADHFRPLQQASIDRRAPAGLVRTDEGVAPEIMNCVPSIDGVGHLAADRRAA